MVVLLRSFIVGAALAAAGAAAGQSGSAAGAPSEIVVTGNRNMGEEVRDFVGALAKAPVGGQLSRFEFSVCPAAVGVPAAQKQAIASRMRRIARAVGMQVGGASCTPNVLVLVTADKKAFIEALWRKHGYYFGGMSGSEVRRLMREPGPAAAWQIDGPPIRADGSALARDGASGLAVNRTTVNPSRITAATRPHFAAAAVVVESRALEGLTTTQLADYAAMRAYARTDPASLADSPTTSILKVLEAPMGSEVPITLTSWDLGYLKALYASEGKLTAAAQRSEMQGILGKELEQAQAAEGEAPPQ
jgi:hypothetical protein